MRTGSRHERFCAVIRRIPRGRVATYGQIADLAGFPGHARQVGYALYALREGTDVPWHRVINARGRLSLGAVIPEGDVEQRIRLEIEGVEFDADGKIDLRRFRWQPKQGRKSAMAKGRRFATALLVCFATAHLSVSAIEARERSSDRTAEILKIHQDLLASHLRNDAGGVLSAEADTIVIVSRGEICHAAKEARTREFSEYLSRTEFEEYRDVIDPIVHVSDDGRTGWLLAQVRIAGSRIGADGARKPFESTWAWIELYERQDGRWRRVGEVSCEKPAPSSEGVDRRESPEAPLNAELAALAAEDQAVRTGGTAARTDDERRVRVFELMAAGAVQTPRDKFNAALVLQHTGLTVCDGSLKSLSAENYLLAHELFKAALAGGVEDARFLVAASIDRYLSFTQGMQRYGTNRVLNRQTGEEELVPIDRRTTDAERAEYGVPPLAELLKQCPEQAATPADR